MYQHLPLCINLKTEIKIDLNEGPGHIIIILGLCFLLLDFCLIDLEAGRVGGGGRLKLDVQGQGCERMVEVHRQKRWMVLKIGHIPWMSYVYRP